MRRYGTLLLAVVLVIGYSAGVNPASITAPDKVTLTVSPLEGSGTGTTGSLKYNIDATSDVTLDASTESGSSWPTGSTLTVAPPDSPAGGGRSNTLNISGITTGATLLEDLTDTTTDHIDILNFSADQVNWDQSAGGSYDLTLVYKLVLS